MTGRSELWARSGSTRPSGLSTRHAWWRTGADLGPGATGELLLRNPAVTPGYWGMPEVTAATIVDGWLHTGDLVTVGTDGTYTFAGRKKEVLRQRGENLSPLEVEEALEQHPAGRPSASCRAHPWRGLPSTGCRPGISGGSMTAKAPALPLPDFPWRTFHD